MRIPDTRHCWCRLMPGVSSKDNQRLTWTLCGLEMVSGCAYDMYLEAGRSGRVMVSILPCRAQSDLKRVLRDL